MAVGLNVTPVFGIYRASARGSPLAQQRIHSGHESNTLPALGSLRV